MKKLLLFAFAASVGTASFAQNTNFNHPVAFKPKPGFVIDRDQKIPAIPFNVRRNSNPPHSASVAGFLDIGQMTNAFGMAFGARTAIWADQRIGTVAVVHRIAVNVNTGTSGDLRFDVSKDRGWTWTDNLGPLFSANGDPQGTPFSVARYPQGGIYNPTGNTIPDSATVVYYAPTRDLSNPGPNSADWGGHCYGVQQISTLNPATMHQTSSTLPNGFLIPTGFTMDQNGVCWGIDPANDQSTGYYTNNMWLAKGVWNSVTRDMDWTETMVPFNVDMDNLGTPNMATANVGFSPNGQVGYLVVIGHNGFDAAAGGEPDSMYVAMVSKSIDGGTTWDAPRMIQLDNMNPLMNSISANGKYTAGFNVDVIVDGAGKCHFIMPMGVDLMGTATPQGWAIPTAPGEWSMVDIFTTDGDQTWRGQVIGFPETYNADFGDGSTANPTISEGGRGQASETWDGTKLFFTYFDTDTVDFPTVGNLNPNMITVGYNTTTNRWTAPVNYTKGSQADGLCTFGGVSQYVFDSAGVYTIPAIVDQLSSPVNTGTQTQIFYLQGLTMADADFSVTDNSVLLNLYGTGIRNLNPVSFTLGQNYPNPFNKTSSFDLTLKKNSNVEFTVSDVVGKVLVNNQMNNLSAGKNQITVDATTFSAGVYFYSVTVDGQKVTRKMIVQ